MTFLDPVLGSDRRFFDKEDREVAQGKLRIWKVAAECTALLSVLQRHSHFAMADHHVEHGGMLSADRKPILAPAAARVNSQ